MKIISSQVNMHVDTLEHNKHYETFKTSSDEFSRLIQETKERSHYETSEPIQKKTKYMINESKNIPVEGSVYRYLAENILAIFIVDKDNPVESIQSNEKEKQSQGFKNFLSSAKEKTIERITEYYKNNKIDFEAQAIIKTANKDINIKLHISYSKEFYETHKEKVDEQGNPYTDPLIIKYDLSSNYFDSISEELYFKFDINSDENDIDIPVLKEGSGFLALDKNSNGSIDNGNELFGPITNNGFEELKQYDEDKNGWIDENDSVFKDLLIWSKTEGGDDKLMAIGDVNIGAIYLTDIQTDFHYDKSINENVAYLKQASIFLTENGKAGLITGVDFAVS